MRQPFDLENEQVVLATALLDRAARRQLLGALEAKDFRGPRHRVVFAAIAACEAEGVEPDVNNVAVHCEGGDYGGLEYLRDVLSRGAASDVGHNLERLRRESARAGALRGLSKLEELILDRSSPYPDVLEAARSIVRTLTDGQTTRGTQDVARQWEEEFEMRCDGQLPFVSTGYGPLDEVLVEGLAKKRMTVIAGRPRAGKSMFLVDMIRRLLEGEVKPRIGMIPLESGPSRWLDMFVASATGTELSMLVKKPNELTFAQRERIRHVVSKAAATDDRLEILEHPFLGLTAKGGWTNESALDRLEEILAVGKYGIIAMDLVQGMLTDLRPQRIATAMIRMQSLFQRYDTHGILVHQLKREVERGKEKRPTLVDLKDSGAYEERPDVVLLVHRDRMYNAFLPDDTIEVTVGKQKLGEDLVTMVADFKPRVCRLSGERLKEEDPF